MLPVVLALGLCHCAKVAVMDHVMPMPWPFPQKGMQSQNACRGGGGGGGEDLSSNGTFLSEK